MVLDEKIKPDSNFSIFIVEDELLIAEMLSENLMDLGYAVMGMAGDYHSAIQFFESGNKPDLCMLDINLGTQKSGFDVAELLREKYQIPFVFLTSYSDTNTIKLAVEYYPEAYLLKPFKTTDLITTIEIIRKRHSLKDSNSHQIVIKDGTSSVKINTRDIVWIKSDNIYVELKLPEKKILLRKSLEGILEELNLDYLVRVHRSFAVNLFHLTAVSGSNLHVGTDVVPVSRLHKENLLVHFKNFKP